MATHSSILAWRIPGTGEPGGLPSLGLHRVGHDWSNIAAAAVLFMNQTMLRYLHVRTIHPHPAFYRWGHRGTERLSHFTCCPTAVTWQSQDASSELGPRVQSLFLCTKPLLEVRGPWDPHSKRLSEGWAGQGRMNQITWAVSASFLLPVWCVGHSHVIIQAFVLLSLSRLLGLKALEL